MNKIFTLFFVAFTILIYGCSSESPVCKPKLQGKWYYGDAPLSYTIIEGDNWIDHLGEMNAEITYKIHYGNNCIIELEVIKAKIPVPVYKKGDKVKISIQEVNEDILQYTATLPSGTETCIYLLRNKNNTVKPGTPC